MLDISVEIQNQETYVERKQEIDKFVLACEFYELSGYSKEEASFFAEQLH